MCDSATVVLTRCFKLLSFFYNNDTDKRRESRLTAVEFVGPVSTCIVSITDVRRVNTAISVGASHHVPPDARYIHASYAHPADVVASDAATVFTQTFHGDDSILNSYQSAYCKHHSTETALLYIHDHLISAIGSQKVSCLCLLDLSAAFDTIDHDILITRLSSWFGIHGSVLSWFKSFSCHLVTSMSNVKPTCLPGTHPPAVFPRLCSWSSTLRHVHHSSQYPHFLLFP